MTGSFYPPPAARRPPPAARWPSGCSQLSRDASRGLADRVARGVVAVRDRVPLCPAPLVEGLVVAAVAAAGGVSRHEVAAEARAALLGKSAHLAPDEATDPSETAAEPSLAATFTVENPHGLHARPAARLVGEVRRLDASVALRNVTTGSDPVPADSLSRVATLGALRGHVVEVSASGRQTQSALDHVLALARRRFDEPDTAGAVSRAASVAGLRGPPPLGVHAGSSVPCPRGDAGLQPCCRRPLRRPIRTAIELKDEIIAVGRTDRRGHEGGGHHHRAPEPTARIRPAVSTIRRVLTACGFRTRSHPSGVRAGAASAPDGRGGWAPAEAG